MLQKMMVMATMAELKLRNLLRDEKGEVNIVAIVVLIGIAVILALFFKDKISNLLTRLFQNIDGRVNRIDSEIKG